MARRPRPALGVLAALAGLALACRQALLFVAVRPLLTRRQPPMRGLRALKPLPPGAVLGEGEFDIYGFNTSQYDTSAIPNVTDYIEKLQIRAKAAANCSYVEDFDDEKIQKFYEETISGEGGKPPEGFLQDLLTRYFTFEPKKRPPKKFNSGHHANALKTLQEQMTLQTWITRGGPQKDTDDDKKGWVWIASDWTCVGHCLLIFKSVPYGRRPIMVGKADNVDELFEKVNWAVVRRRVDVSVYDELALDKFDMEDRRKVKGYADREALWSARKPGGRGARCERVKPPHWRSLFKKGKQGARTGKPIEVKDKLKNCDKKRRQAVGNRR